MEEHTCENCSNRFTESYCNRCGQQLAHRISMSHIFHDIAHAFTHADKGLLHLFLQLFLKPGVVAREYIIENRRKRYYSPFQYILIIGSIAVFVAASSHFMQHTIGLSGPAVYSKRQAAVIELLSHYMGKYFNIVILVQLPFYALGSFLMYRRFHLNYAEHLTRQTFITAQTTFFSMLVMLVIAVSGKPGLYIGIIVSLISSVYQVFALVQFFGEFSIKGVIRAIVTYIISTFFFTLFVALLVFITAVLVTIAHKAG